MYILYFTLPRETGAREEMFISKNDALEPKFETAAEKAVEQASKNSNVNEEAVTNDIQAAHADIRTFAYDTDGDGFITTNERDAIRHDLHKFNNPLDVALNVLDDLSSVINETASTLNNLDKSQLNLTA